MSENKDPIKEPIKAKLHEFHTKTRKTNSNEELERVVDKTADELRDEIPGLVQAALIVQLLRNLNEAVTKLASPELPVVNEIHSLNEKVVELTKAIGNVKPGGVGAPVYHRPTYKRTLRAGETLAEVQGITDEKLYAARRDVRTGAAKKLAELLADKAFDVKDVKTALAKFPGAKESLDAVRAAFIDRTNMDQTTRLLLTTPNVLELEFLRVVKDGTPQFWDTMATVEAIRKGLHAHATELYTALVKYYAKERGWADVAQIQIVDTLKARYGKAVGEVTNA